MLGRISHPSIVRYFGCQVVGTTNNPRKHLWIVMELVHGDTLHARVFTTPEASDILKWAGQLAAGLAYLQLQVVCVYNG